MTISLYAKHSSAARKKENPDRKGPGKNLLFCFFEHVLADSADGADPVIGNILKGCAGSDAAVGITNLRIIHISAGITYILIHNKTLLRIIALSELIVI